MTSPRALSAGFLLAVLAGCDGGAPGAGVGTVAPPRQREPADAGFALDGCSSWRDCPDGTICVRNERSAGHCLVSGGGGAACRPADHPAGRCDPGLACAGKRDTCVPAVGVNALCAAAACAPGTSCGVFAHPEAPAGAAPAPLEIYRCAAEGALGGACRPAAPRCAAGLGCVSGAGVCAPTSPDGACFDGRVHFGCPDNQACGHFPRDLSTDPAACAVPGVAGGPCGDPSRGRWPCADGLACAGGVCRADAILPGGGCIAGAAHLPCIDGFECSGGACLSLGIDGRPCRSPAQFATPCDPDHACEDGVCRYRLPAGAACGLDPVDQGPCGRDLSCLAQAPSGSQCTSDGGEGARCRSPGATCEAGLVCARARDGGSMCRRGLPAGAGCAPAREPFEPCVSGYHCGWQERSCLRDGTLGARCAVGSDDGAREVPCGSGQICADDRGASFCFPAPAVVAPGQACDMSATVYQRANRCSDGHHCVAGLCVAAGSVNAPCRPLIVESLARGGRCDAGLACSGAICFPGKGAGADCVPGGDGDCGAPLLCVGPPGAGLCRAVAAYRLAVVDTSGAPPIDACADGTRVPLADFGDRAIAPRDDGQARVELPFVFPFFGESRSEIFVSSNGVAGFPDPGQHFSPGWGGSGALPAGNAAALLAPFWDDLVLGEARVSEICQQTTGIPGQRRFLLTWRNLGRFGRAGVNLTFTLVLAESGGTIEFSYGDLAGEGADAAFASGVRAAIGVQSAGGIGATVYAGAVSVRRTLRFSP